MDIAISGSSGLVGTALAAHLADEGHRPVAIVRRDPHPGHDEIRWDPTRGEIDAASLEGIDAVVNLAGAGIGDRRWNAEYKQLLVSSRATSTALLASTLAGLTQPPACFLSASAIGFYGNRGDEVLTESSPAGSGFLADLVVKWEAAAVPAADAGIRTSLLRMGLVLDAEGGALTRLLPLFRWGLGGRFGRGRHYQSWITLDDTVRAIAFLVDHAVAGPVNLTAPNPVTNAVFTSTLAKVLRRPALLPIPPFGPKLVVGSEMAQALLFDSQRIEPAALLAVGFDFHHPELGPALTSVLRSDR